jgi:hypothetical protein
MDPIVLAAGTAVVSAVATDGWQRAKVEVVELWRRVLPGEAPQIATELDVLREELLLAADDSDAEAMEAVEAFERAWQLKLQRLVTTDPGITPELRAVLRRLNQLDRSDRSMTVIGRDQYTAGRDQIFNHLPKKQRGE